MSVIKTLVSCLALSVIISTPLMAQNNPSAHPPSKSVSPTPTTQKVAFLGTSTIPVGSRNQIGELPRGVGVVLKMIIPDSPAAKAGLKAQDVLYKFGDQWVINPSQLKVLTQMKEPGEEVKLEVMRGDKKVTVTVKLEMFETAAVPSSAESNDDKTRMIIEMLQNKMESDALNQTRITTIADPEHNITFKTGNTSITTIEIRYLKGEKAGKTEIFKVKRDKDGQLILPKEMHVNLQKKVKAYEKNSNDPDEQKKLEEMIKKHMEEKKRMQNDRETLN